MDSLKQIGNQSQDTEGSYTQNNTVHYGSNQSNMMQISSSNVLPYDIDHTAIYNQLLPHLPKLDFDYNSSRIAYHDQLPDLIPNQQNYPQYIMNPAPLDAPPYHVAASNPNPNVFWEDKKRISWDGDRQRKFCQVVQNLGGLHEATALKIFKDMKDPELNLGNVSSHLQHERDIAGIKSKRSTTDDQDSGLQTNRKKRRITRDSSPDHNCPLWTPNLQNKFVSAVQKLGDIATAIKILHEMCEPTLTRQQVNSHLQNYKKKLAKVNVEKEEETAANAMKERGISYTDHDDEEHGSHLGTTNESIIINNIDGLEEWLNTILADDTERLDQEWLNSILTDDTDKPDRASTKEDTAKNNLTDMDEGLEEWLNTVLTNDTEFEEWLNSILTDDTDKPDRASTKEDTAKNNLTDMDEIFGNLESIVAIDEEHDHRLVIVGEEHGHNLEERIIITDDADERE